MADQNPGRERARLAELYASMADGELEKLASEAATLSDVAREVLRAEIAKRKLQVASPSASAPEKQHGEEHPNLITLRKFLNVQEAQLAKSVLESAGIDSVLADENTVRMDWFWSNAIGGVKLLVREDDAPAAAELLDQSRPETIDVEGDDEYEQPRCPRCNSSDVSFQPLKRRAAYASVALGIPVPFKHLAWKCHNCGHLWEEANDGSDKTP